MPENTTWPAHILTFKKQTCYYLVAYKNIRLRLSKKQKNVMLIWNPKIQRSLWQLNQMAHPITADSGFWVPTAFDSLAIPKISQPLDVLFRKCSHLLKRHETALSGREIHLGATTFKYFQIKLDWNLQNHFIFPHRKC